MEYCIKYSIDMLRCVQPTTIPNIKVRLLRWKEREKKVIAQMVEQVLRNFFKGS